MEQDLAQGNQMPAVVEGPSISDLEVNEKQEDSQEVLDGAPPVEDPNTAQHGAESKPQPWWLEIPYVCVLILKSCGNFFMMDIGAEGKEEFSIIAFEV